MVPLREGRQLLVGGEREIIQVHQPRPAGIGDDARPVAPHQVRDIGQGLSLHQIQQRAFPFAQAEEVQLGEALQQGRSQARGMHTAHHHAQARSGRLQQGRQIHRIHEP